MKGSEKCNLPTTTKSLLAVYNGTLKTGRKKSRSPFLNRNNSSSSQAPTLHDIARLAGVSYQTVSRVINQRPDVADETRKRITKIIADLNYQPNKAARSLAGRYSRTLGLVSQNMTDYGPATVLDAAEKFTKKAGYDLVTAHAVDSSIQSMLAALNSLQRWSIDGALLFLPVASEIVEHLYHLQPTLPIVLIDAPLDTPIPSVKIDQWHGAERLGHYLADLGHRRICEITGPLHWYGAVQRHQGLQAGLLSRGVQILKSLEGNWSARSGYELTMALLKTERFTALAVGNDEMALGAMRAIREHGLRIPEDISVTGFDDIPSAEYFEPPLTTVRQDFATFGNHSVEYLINLIQKLEQSTSPHLIPTDMIIRHSTASPNDQGMLP
jgi:DNA-binding LacI/PurR family transcriptional regulator